MDGTGLRIELALKRALSRTVLGAPPKLAAAMNHAVFPGGQRIRPRLALSVAKACGDDHPEIADAAAAAVEFLHCASLVHDDMPCFDDADIRRGKASVHVAFSEPLALLAGDGLIVLAFELASEAGEDEPRRALALSGVLARAVGMPSGIVAGQGWESEPSPDLALYQRAKTGALFAGAAMAGAAAAGQEPAPWGELGHCLGEAYQVADDLRDVLCSPAEIGKPAGQDEALGRPNVVASLGVAGAAARLRGLIEQAASSVPDCIGRDTLCEHIRAQASRFLPREASADAA